MDEKPRTVVIISYCLLIVRSYFPIIVVSALAARGILKRYLSPLRQYPGPFIASCSRIWKFWTVYKGHNEADHIEAHRKYG